MVNNHLPLAQLILLKRFTTRKNVNFHKVLKSVPKNFYLLRYILKTELAAFNDAFLLLIAIFNRAISAS